MWWLVFLAPALSLAWNAYRIMLWSWRKWRAYASRRVRDQWLKQTASSAFAIDGLRADVHVHEFVAGAGYDPRNIIVNLVDPQPHPGWLALQDPALSKKEKDRTAILAMAGPYRASFEFLETVGYTPDFERSRPYQSWGTEYVYVVEESEDFISLQHIMVMFAVGPQGDLMGPFVQKHWRQDWAFEKTDLLVYAGHDIWEQRNLDATEVAGTWAQSVFQVDDSPRYEAIGNWQHYPNFSTWLSDTAWRPLPRGGDA